VKCVISVLNNILLKYKNMSRLQSSQAVPAAKSAVVASQKSTTGEPSKIQFKTIILGFVIIVGVAFIAYTVMKNRKKEAVVREPQPAAPEPWQMPIPPKHRPMHMPIPQPMMPHMHHQPPPAPPLPTPGAVPLPDARFGTISTRQPEPGCDGEAPLPEADRKDGRRDA